MESIVEAFLSDPTVHKLAKDTLCAALRKDPVDAIEDLEGVLAVLRARLARNERLWRGRD